jgi:hypothetical protein
MQTQHKAIPDSQAELEADSGPRQRRQSGIGARGQGIRVEGDEPFDPYRFQTFEVTPAFRQSILEAPLPLLELRDRLHLARPVQHSTIRAKSPHRGWLALAVGASALLGLAFAHLYTRDAKPAKLQQPAAAVDVPLLPAVPVNANQPKQADDPPARHAANPAANASAPRASIAHKIASANKKLWLPVE